MKDFSIHPAIGIARLGRSPTDVMFAPEAPMALPTEQKDGAEVPVERFRDATGQIKREAARFRIYDRDGQLLKIGQDGLIDIEWTTWLANKKAQWFEFKGSVGDLPGRRRKRNNKKSSAEDRRQLII